MGKSKKQKIVYKDGPDAKAEELEQFLFGSKSNAAQLFAQDEEDDTSTRGMPSIGKGVTDGGEDLGFFEDKRGEALSEEELEPEQDDAAGTSADEEEAEAGEGSGPSASTAWADGLEKEQLEARRKAGSKSSGRPEPVWSDPADLYLKVNIAAKANLRKLRRTQGQKVVNGTQYEAALRKQHTILNPRTAWASEAAADKRSKRSRGGFGAGSDSDAEAEAEAGAGAAGAEWGLVDDEVGGAEQLLRSAGGLLGRSRGAGRRLAAGTLELSRLKDANQHEPNASVVSSVEWHPEGQLLMTAGLDKKIRLFQVDGSRNSKVQSIFLEDCPVHTASWASGGSQIIAVGRRPHFYIYDVAASRIERVGGPLGSNLKSLETFVATQGSPESCGPAGPMAAFLGDQGNIPLVSLKSRQWIGNLKMSGTVRSAAFSSDGTELLTAGSDGVVYTWDMRMRRCVAQMVDMGNKDSASLAVSRDNKYLATGSASGVVNVYNRDQCQPGGAASGGAASLLRRTSPAPLKEIMNLTTTVDTLAFSPDAQILAIASRMKKDALRLVHLPSCTVFSNWPTSRTPIHFVHALAFSPNGGFLAVGNARGHVLLYRLHHYSEA